MNKILAAAITEEEVRRKTSYYELNKLEHIVKEKAIEHFEKQSLLAIVENDKKIITALNEAIKDFSPHASLKYNKLSEIFQCTHDIISLHIEKAIKGNLLIAYNINENDKQILGGDKNTDGEITNFFGTSKPNCIQNVYLTILREDEKAYSINQISELKEYEIYNVDVSPNIQTTKLPDMLSVVLVLMCVMIIKNSGVKTARQPLLNGLEPKLHL